MCLSRYLTVHYGYACSCLSCHKGLIVLLGLQSAVQGEGSIYLYFFVSTGDPVSGPTLLLY